MSSEPATPASPVPVLKKSRLGTWALRILGTIFLISLLLVGSLFWPGWPLHWVLRSTIATQARAFDCEVTLPDLWLRAHTDGTLRLTASAVTVGDATQRQAVQLHALEIRWPLADLFERRALPATLSLDSVELRPAADADGKLRLAGQPKPAAVSTT
ncbi:MAG: hypothetical protein RIQ79_1502, partial [Verrucomicrobiota bacterium]